VWKKSLNWVFWSLTLAAAIWSLRLFSLETVLHLLPFLLLAGFFSLLKLEKKSLILDKKTNFPFLAAISFPLALIAPFYFVFFVLLLALALVFWERKLSWDNFSNFLVVEFLPVAFVYLAFHLLSVVGWLADTPAFLTSLLLALFFFSRLTLEALMSLPSPFYPFASYYRYEFDFIGGELLYTLTLGYLFYLLFLNYGFWASLVYLLYLPYLFIWSRERELNEEDEEFLLAIYQAIESSEPGLKQKIERVKDLSLKIGSSLGLPSRSLFNLALSSSFVHLAEVSLDKFSLESFLEKDKEEEGLPFHARFGAEVLESTPSTKEIAAIVYNHHRPFFLHKSRAKDEGSLPIEARIIFLVNAFDDLVHDSRDPLRPEEAWRTIQKDQGFLYDPKLVRQLRKVLEEEGFFQRRAGGN